MSIKKLLVLCCVLIQFGQSAITLTKNTPNYKVSDSHAFDPHNYLTIRFTITNPTNKIIYALPIASFKGYIQEKPSLSDFYNVLPSEDLMYDIEALWAGNSQHYINVKPKYNTTVYVTVFNLDPDDRRTDITFNLQITWGQSSLTCPTCPGVVKQSDYCSCKDCPNIDFYGYDCSRKITTLSGQKLNYQFVMNSNQLVHLIAPMSSNQYLILQISTAMYMQCYINFQNSQGQVASYVNHEPSGFIQFNKDHVTQTITIQNSNDKNILITIGFYNIGINVFTISYEYKNTFNVIYIILIVLGVVICFLIVVLVIFLIWFFKCRRPIVSQSRMTKVKKVDNKLSDEQINKYFPQFIPTQIKNQEETVHYLKQQEDLNPMFQQDCVICLCSIENNTPARITYCKHVFHSKCLLNWFKKQRNCPYCRQQFGRVETSTLYEKLKQQNQTALAGISLVKAIHSSQPNFYIKEIEPIKIQIQQNSSYSRQEL